VGALLETECAARNLGPGSDVRLSRIRKELQRFKITPNERTTMSKNAFPWTDGRDSIYAADIIMKIKPSPGGK
jgi:hypothetical protein